MIALVARDGGDRQILFCREKNEEREIWDGFRYGPDAAREIFGFDAAHPIAELAAMLPDLASDQPALYTPLGLFPAWDRHDRRPAERGARPRAHRRQRAGGDRRRAAARSTRCASSRTRTSSTLMRRAAAISAGAHRRAMQRTRPGWFEYQVEAELAHEFLQARRAGGRLSVDRRRRPQRLRAALPRQRPAAAGRRAAADRRRLRIRELRVGHHAHVSRSTAGSPGRSATSTSSCSRRSRRASTR